MGTANKSTICIVSFISRMSDDLCSSFHISFLPRTSLFFGKGTTKKKWSKCNQVGYWSGAGGAGFEFVVLIKYQNRDGTRDGQPAQRDTTEVMATNVPAYRFINARSNERGNPQVVLFQKLVSLLFKCVRQLAASSELRLCARKAGFLIGWWPTFTLLPLDSLNDTHFRLNIVPSNTLWTISNL